MKLRSLDIRRSPGIRPGFVLDGIDPGVNLVVGPNASGKSSLMRALRAVLYRQEQPHTPLHVEAVLADGGGDLTATRLGRDLTWQRAGQPVDPPRLPEHRFLYCYTLRVEDLLEHAGETDKAIAERLARDLAGGYDISSVHGETPFRIKTTHASREARALREAERALSRKQREHAALRDKESKLERLRRDKEAAEAARIDARAHRAAWNLLEARRQRKAREAQLAEFPQNMAQLRGDELERLARLRADRGEQIAALEQARHDERTAQHELRASALDGTDLDEAKLGDHRAPVQRLRQLETRIEQRREELTRATAELDRTTQALGGAAQTAPSLDPGTIHRVEEALAGKRALDTEILRLDSELERLSGATVTTSDPQHLRTARAELLHWLAAARKPAWGWVRSLAAFLIGSTAALGLAAAAIGVHWLFALLFLPAIVGMGLALFPSDPDKAERTSARRRFESSGIDRPSSWDRDRVQSKLHELDRALQESERKAADDTRAAELARRREARLRDVASVREALAKLAHEVGFDPQKLDASLERWIKLLADYDHARAADDSARRILQRQWHEAGEIRAALSAFLRAHGEAPQTGDPEADTLGARLDHLCARVRQRDHARQAIEGARRDIRRIADAITRIDEHIRAVFAEAGLAGDDETALRAHVEKLQAWQESKEKLREARAVERERAPALGNRPDLHALIGADDDASLRSRCIELDDKAASHEKLVQEIARIDSEIEAAGKERELEHARAQVQQAKDGLSDRLAEALFAEAGSYLLEQVDSEHVRASQPAALRQAKEWFRRFTHHQFELEFDRDGDSRFAATETASGERRGLSELSSGTRMQLLLAVRIAFALEAEKGCEPLPLVLDEALTTADPERFRAAARSLNTLAREGDRQVFYLTAQPEDIAYWNAQEGRAHCIDLAQVRRSGRAITDPNRIYAPPAPEIPAPAGRSPEDYAVALGVPGVDPWAEPRATHVFYLLRDDLDLLRRLMEARIEYVGNLRSFLESAAAGELLSPEEQKRLRRRTAGVEAWLDAWRHGRGRPVDRQTLAEADAVTETYLDRVAEQCTQVRGDAAALLQRLEAGEVRGFRTKKSHELREWLLERGYLDARERLSQAVIEHRVLSAIASYVDERERGLPEARLLSASLGSGVGH